MYLATLRKENDESLYKKFSNNIVNLDEVNEILNDFISTHNKNFDFFFINCEFGIEFDNNFTAKIKNVFFS